MKRLLIILITSPIIFLARSRAQVTNDVIQDAALKNLKGMADAMTNNKCAKSSEILINDSGDYPTVVVFRYASYGDAAADEISQVPVKIDKLSVANPGAIEITPDRIAEMRIVTAANIPDLREMELADFPDNMEPARLDTLATPPAPGMSIPSVSELEPIAGPIDLPIEDIDTPVVKEIVVTVMPVGSYSVSDLPLIKDIVDDALTRNKDIKLPVQELHLSTDGYSLLQKLEGYAPSLYDLHDGGYTIGFGFFVPYNEGYKWSKGVSWEEAEVLIRQKVPSYEAQVKKYVNVLLTQSEFDALTLLAYNLGGFSKATSIISDINEQVDFDKLQSDWKRFIHSKAPNVSKGLLNRRKDELEVRRSSNYQPERKIQIFNGKKI